MDIHSRVSAAETDIEHLQKDVAVLETDVKTMRDYINKAMGSNGILIFIATFAANGMMGVLAYVFTHLHL